MAKKKLKIAIVCWPSLGGSGAVATNLGVELAKRGHEIHLIAHDALYSLKPEDSFQKNLTFHVVEDVDYPLFENASVYVLSLANKIAEICRRYDIDIINTHYSVPHAAAAALAKLLPGTGAKLINTFHGTDVSQMAANLNLQEVNHYAIDQCDGLTAVAKSLADSAREGYSIDPNKEIKVIYNWFDKPKYRETSAEQLRDLFANGRERLVVHVSNFREVKRINDVIEIFRGIQKLVPAKLLLIGDGPEQRIAHRLISRYKLINKVLVLGIQTNVSRILSISDLFLLPSASEGFSLAALEAMSFGIPVITTNTGGMPELITDSNNGFLADVGDTTSMIAKGIRVLSDPELHKNVGRQAALTVEQHYTSKRIVPQYEEYYYEVLEA